MGNNMLNNNADRTSNILGYIWKGCNTQIRITVAQVES
jgi:hypothetical protein